jgi:1-acyl-sn-glycerol-3-phosphate acyltransferase
MNTILRYLFFILIVKPAVFFLIGVNTYHRERLPKKGPAIIVANHNSHLDTLILMSLFPLKLLSSIRPVGAADYFLRNKWIAWFANKIIGIIPIARSKLKHSEDPLQGISKVLSKNGIVIFFPEGSRGLPEKLAKLKTGIAHVASRHPDVDVVPIFLYGAGKVLPKGEALLVPFVVDVEISEPIRWSGDKNKFIAQLEEIFTELAAHNIHHDDE